MYLFSVKIPEKQTGKQTEKLHKFKLKLFENCVGDPFLFLQI